MSIARVLHVDGGATRMGGSLDDPELMAASLLDLAEDFEEIEFLAADSIHGLVEAQEEVHAARRAFLRDTRLAIRDEIARRRAELSTVRGLAEALNESARSAEPTPRAVARLADGRRRLADLLRIHRTLAAAAITATDWQSPSFGHSRSPAAGRFTGRVVEHHDDYRRDRHLDAARFEEAYLREYVDSPPGMPLRALMTASGMAGFTTILHLVAERAAGPALLGRGTYHECRDLVHRSPLGATVTDVDERDPAAVAAAVSDVHPRVVFLDALCNAKCMAVPDVRAAIRALAALPGPPPYLVVDTTALSCASQPFAVPGADRVRILTLESLTKYAQFGLDRVTAGMIVAGADDGERLDDLREHLGTNASDLAPHVVPRPVRRRLQGRLERLGRNTSILAEAVRRSATGGVVVGAIQPGPTSDAVAPGDGRFRGGFLAVAFDHGSDRVECHRAFVRATLSAAASSGVPLVAGASFGFDTTRIYLTASRTDHGAPFVRIAAGTEHLAGAHALGAALADATRSLG